MLLFVPIATLTWQWSYPASAATIRPAAFVTPKPSQCATADALRKAGLLTEAHDRYVSLLSQKVPPDCAVTGLKLTAERGEAAAGLEADGDAAAAAGAMSDANSYYTRALAQDRGNQAALAGLEKLDQQQPDSIRQARDHWNQIIANTLVPIGQFFLWFLAVFAGMYILYLLTRVAARWMWIKAMPPRPAWQGRIKGFALFCFGLAAAAIGGTAYLGVSGHQSGSAAGDWWLVLLVANGTLVIIGCLLSAWYLRSGSVVQFSVTNESGNADNTACAFLAGRLQALGAKPPRGFDLPEGTDVTSLTNVLTLLPGGGMLSALAGLLQARVPTAPWRAVVTLVDKERFLVTLHRNGRLLDTVLADREALFFPNLVSGQDSPPAAAAYAELIDRCDLLTIAAAVILVSMAMADDRSPLRRGLNGATDWRSVAGQVLATGQGLSGNEDFGKALLERAVDIDPGNLSARVARVNMDGRRASDAASRRDFATRIGDLAEVPALREPGYEALRLRVLYSSAAGWSNVYLDDQSAQTWCRARDWTARFIGELYDLTETRRFSRGKAVQSLAQRFRPQAYILWTALGGFDACPPPGGFGAVDQAKIRATVSGWQPTGPQTSAISYAQACYQAVREQYAAALRSLRQAVEVDDGLRTWAQSDPSFTRLRANRPREFLAIVGVRPPATFTEVGPMARYTKQLNDIGVHNAVDLNALTCDDAKLKLFAQAVGVPELVAERWRNIAGLATLPRGPEPGQLNLLVTVGVDSISALHAAVEKDLTRLLRDLAAAGMYSATSFRTEDLTRWAHAPQAAPTAANGR
ncbi:MAG TPA: DUF4332 domain-containing protein [Streptosporangiaceae bacterium]